MAARHETPSDILEAAGVKVLDEEALKDWPPKPKEDGKDEGKGEGKDEDKGEEKESKREQAKEEDTRKASFLFFTAPWCEVSLEAAPRLAKLLEEFRGRAAFFQVDADRAPLATEKLNVRSVPAVIAFARGQEISRCVGLTGEDELERFAEDAVKEAEAGQADEVGTDRDVPEKESAGEDKP